jgi:hypothetical protein
MENCIDEFEDVVTSIYGVYLMSTQGFHLLVEELMKIQHMTINRLKGTHPERASVQYMDSTLYIFGKGDPNLPTSIELYRCTQGEYKERNSEKGINSRFIGNMCVIAIYQYWEDYFRQKIANFLNRTSKNELTSDIMGDIKILRRSIIHHRGIALKDVENCKLLRWFKKGDDIFIDKDMMQHIVFQVKSYLLALRGEVQKSLP